MRVLFWGHFRVARLLMFRRIFVCAGLVRSQSLGRLRQGFAEIVVLGQVHRLGCGVGGLGHGRGTAVTSRAENGDPITEVDVIPTRGVCLDGIGTGR